MGFVRKTLAGLLKPNRETRFFFFLAKGMEHKQATGDREHHGTKQNKTKHE